jgi:dTDP-4-dehydrorhamnose 3,5-epimerase
LGKDQLNKIKVTRMKIAKSPKGDVMQILKKKDLKKWNFQEAYISKIKFNKIKAWKYHKKMMLNLVVPKGKVKFVFYSYQNDRFRIIEIGEKKYSRLTVPPKIWFGFKGTGKTENMIINLSNYIWNPKEQKNMKKNKLKFNW